MPRITQFFNRQEIDASPLSAAAHRVEIMGNEAGAAIRGGLNTLGAGIQQREDANDLTSAYADIGALTMKTHQDATDALQTADPTDKEFVNGFLDKTFQPQADAVLDKYSGASRRVQEQIQREVNQTKTTLGLRLIGEQSAAAAKNADDNIKIATNTNAISAATDPASLPSILQQSDRGLAALAGHGIPVSQINSAQADARSEIANHAAVAQASAIESNPKTTPAQIDAFRGLLTDPNGAFRKNMTDSQYVSVLDRLDKAKNAQMSAQSEIAKINFPDVIAQSDLTGNFDAPRALRNTYIGKTAAETQVEQYRMDKTINEHEAMWKQSDIKFMGPTEAQARLSSLQDAASKAPPDKAGAAELSFEMAQKILVDRDKAFSKAPAQYMIDNDNSVSALYNKFKQDPNPQNFAAYASFSAGAQRRMYPDVEPSVITDEIRGEAKGVVTSIGTDTAGATNAAKSLYVMSQKYGPYWNGIASDLKAEHILSDEQYVAASMAPNPRSQGTAEAILNASSMSGGDRFNMHHIAEAKARNIAIDALAPLEASLGNLPASQRAQLVSGYTNALTHVMQTGGATTAEAASGLADKMIMGEFQFVGSMRVPAALDGGAVKNGAASVLKDIGNHKLVVPPSAGALGPTNQHANYVTQLQSSGRWYTNANGTGALLYDENMHNVMETIKGRTVPVELKWDDLSKLGKAPAATGAHITDLERGAIR